MTKETEVEAAPEPVMASRDEEIVETVDMDPPEPEVRADIEDVISTQEDPRAEIYKRQKEKREEEIAAQTGGFVENPPEIDEIDDENAELAVDNDDSVAIIEATPGQTDTPSDSDEMVTVKILGDFRQVLKSKVDAQGGIENYQIRIAAQEQMERNAHEARAIAERKKSLDEQERRLTAAQAEIPAMDSRNGQNPDRSTQLDGQNLEEMARQYQEAVYDDAAEAPSILARMVSQAAQSGKTFDKEAFRQQVRQDVLADQRQAKIVKAGRTLIGAHPELQMKSPKFDRRMYEAIDGETIIVEREHADWEPEEVVQEAYNRISEWKGSPQPETMSDKQAQKRAMSRPRAGSQRYAPPPPPPRQTNSDYVQQERKRRGLE